MRKMIILATAVAISGLTAIHSANAATYSFTPIDVPGARFTDAFGINDAGQIVGGFSDSTVNFTASSTPAAASPKSTCRAHPVRRLMASTTRGRSSVVLQQHGWPRLPRHRRQLHPNRRAGRIHTRLMASTTRGRSSVNFCDSTGSPTASSTPAAASPQSTCRAQPLRSLRHQRRGADRRDFYRHGTGSPTASSTPAAASPKSTCRAHPLTEASGINDAGQIVGIFSDSTGDVHGFLDTGGSFTQIDVPGASLRRPLASTTRGRSSVIFSTARVATASWLPPQPPLSRSPLPSPFSASASALPCFA